MQNDPYNLYGLTGSRMATQKPAIPIGIYIVAGLNVLSFIATFFDTSQTSLIYTLDMLLCLLAALGLAFRIEAARKTLIVLAGITIVLSVISAFLLANLQGRIAASKQRYETAVSKIDSNTLSLSEKQQLATIKTDLESAEKKAGKAISYTYALMGFYILESAGVMIYLGRPRVKSVFAR
jgi:uncharacterized protein YlxP (DUF503 family)